MSAGAGNLLIRMVRSPEWHTARLVCAWNVASAAVVLGLVAWFGAYSFPLLIGVFTLSSTFAVGVIEQEDRRVQ